MAGEILHLLEAVVKDLTQEHECLSKSTLLGYDLTGLGEHLSKSDSVLTDTLRILRRIAKEAGDIKRLARELGELCNKKYEKEGFHIVKEDTESQGYRQGNGQGGSGDATYSRLKEEEDKDRDLANRLRTELAALERKALEAEAAALNVKADASEALRQAWLTQRDFDMATLTDEQREQVLEWQRQKEEEEKQKAEEEKARIEKEKGLEEERKRIEEEERRQKEEEERKQRDEEERKLEEERRQREEEERKRKEDEERQQEEERRKKEEEEREKREREEAERRKKDPNYWPAWMYDVEPGNIGIGVGCVVRASPGSLTEDQLDVTRLEQLNGRYRLEEGEQLVSHIIDLTYTDPGLNITLDEPLAVALPISGGESLTRRVVIKTCPPGGEWEERETQEVNIREGEVAGLRLVQARLQPPVTMTAVSRSRTQGFDIPREGAVISPSADERIRISVPPDLFPDGVRVQITVEPISQRAVDHVRSAAGGSQDSMLSCSPLLTMEPSPERLTQPVSMTLPVTPDDGPDQEQATTSVTVEEEEVHLMKWPEKGKVRSILRQPHDPADKTVTFNVKEFLKRFIVLKTKANTSNELLELMSAAVARLVNRRPAQFLLRQRNDNPGDVTVMCVSPSRVETCKRELHAEGYTDGPNPAAPTFLDEGQILKANFLGNVEGRFFGAKRMIFNSQQMARLGADVTVKNPLEQKNIGWYRGQLQLILGKRISMTLENTQGKQETEVAKLIIKLPKEKQAMLSQKFGHIYNQSGKEDAKKPQRKK